ncbi:MAG TPA: DUF86 domain-containing protein [Thermoanaerobaculia bacterium]|nr:DUF86 domain-containing protein [Thermoanaerobaculia bacterium]HXT52421.1 DUF86 domain-containing protein [Thermoanaerobaculia bacterium]
MTRGRVDLKMVADRLSLVDRYLGRLRQLPAARDEFLADPRNVDSAESLIRRALEALLDPARHLLAKGFGIAALEYREIARVAVERQLVRGEELGEAFRRMAGFRIRLTHHYEEVTDAELFGIVNERLGDIQAVREQLAETAAALAEK